MAATKPQAIDAEAEVGGHGHHAHGRGDGLGGDVLGDDVDGVGHRPTQGGRRPGRGQADALLAGGPRHAPGALVGGRVGGPTGPVHLGLQPPGQHRLDRHPQLGRQRGLGHRQGGQRVVVVGAQPVVGGHEAVGQVVGHGAGHVAALAGQCALQAELAGPEQVDGQVQQLGHALAGAGSLEEGGHLALVGGRPVGRVGGLVITGADGAGDL